MSLNLSILTPTKKLVTDLEVESVSIPAFQGEMTVLDEHSTLITSLDSGILAYKSKANNKTEKMAVSWGYCEVINQEVSVLAEIAKVKEDVDIDQAKESKKQALEEMSQSEDLNVVKNTAKKIKEAETQLKL